MFVLLEADFPQGFGDGLWVEVIVQLNKLDLFRSKWIPALTAQDPAQDRLEIAFVGKFEQESPVFRQHTPHLAQGSRRVSHVVEGADHGRAVKKSTDKRQLVDVGCDKDIAVALAQPFARLEQLRAGIVEQNDSIPVLIARGHPTGTRAKLKQKLAALAEEPVERDGLDRVLITAIGGIPKAGLVI